MIGRCYYYHLFTDQGVKWLIPFFLCYLSIKEGQKGSVHPWLTMTTRPSNLRGSHMYRASLREQEASEAKPEHTIEDARRVLANKRSEMARERALANLPTASSEIVLASVAERNFSSSSRGIQQELALRFLSLPESTFESIKQEPSRLVSSLVRDVARPVSSKKAEAAGYEESAKTVGNRTQQCAAAVINFQGLLWEQALLKLIHLSETGRCRLIAFIKKRRYDETPSRIKIPVGGSHSDNTFAKILQSEGKISMLLFDNETNKYMLVEGHFPTYLQAIDRNTGETIRQAQRGLESSIPRLNAMSKMFDFKLAMINTDRFSANFRCERAMQKDHPHYVKCHYGCDHHACGTVLGKSFALDIPSNHISAMIAGSLSMQDANSVESFRNAVMSCIADKLRIRVGKPPEDGHLQKHKEAVYDMLLGPIPEIPHRSSRGLEQKRARQRLTLSYFFNGNIQDGEHIDFWTTSMNPNKELILSGFYRFAIPALVPSKPYLFPRRKWTNTELAIDWYALIDFHHQLLGPSVDLWLQRAGDKLVEKPAEQTEPTIGWADVLMGQICEARDSKEDDGDEPAGVQAEVSDPKDAKDEWAEKRKQFRKRFRLWSRTSPAGTLAVMRCSIAPAVHLTYSLLHLVGDKWEKEQQEVLLQGSPRSYPVLEAARGTPLVKFWNHMHQSFHARNYTLPPSCWTRKFQTLLLRMLSCIATSMAFQVGTRWSSYPVRLFTLLDGDDDSECVSDCPDLLDELAAAFFKKYPTHEDRIGVEAQIVLTAICSSFTLGIAEIEARHASTRRLAHIKGCQTHVPSLIDVGASWALRRHAAMQRSASLFHDSKSKTGEQSVKEERVPDGRSGGTWRAFVNANLNGRTFKEASTQLSAAYKALDPEDLAHYQSIGDLAKVSRKRGFSAFKRATPDASFLAARPEANLTSSLDIVPRTNTASDPPDDVLAVKMQLDQQRDLHRVHQREEVQREESLRRQIIEFQESQQPSVFQNIFTSLDSAGQVQHQQAWQQFPNPLPEMQHAKVHLPADILTEARFVQSKC